MTRFFLSILFCFVVYGLAAQENSFVTIGAGHPVFTGIKINDRSHYDYNINKGNYNLFLEKEIKLLKKAPQLRLTPGLGYVSIKESYENESLGGGGEANYKHQAFSTYLKLIYKIDGHPKIVTDYYFGIHTGYYIYSNTTGSKSSWRLNPDGLNYSNHEEIDKSGKDFFHSTYIGIIGGFRPLGGTNSFLQPNIELAFYPSFATLNSYYYNDEKQKNMFQITISVGIGRKSKVLKKENHNF